MSILHKLYPGISGMSISLFENDRLLPPKRVVVEKDVLLRCRRPGEEHLRARLFLRKPVVVNPRLLLRLPPNPDSPHLGVHEGIVVDQDLCPGYVCAIPSISAYRRPTTLYRS